VGGPCVEICPAGEFGFGTRFLGKDLKQIRNYIEICSSNLCQSGTYLYSSLEVKILVN
jgi:hypothetical protein